ncbi:MAG: hypothetical protein R6W95_11365 [Desulfosarcina sp.]
MALTSDPTLPARSAGHFGDLMQLIAQVIVPGGAVTDRLTPAA